MMDIFLPAGFRPDTRTARTSPSARSNRLTVQVGGIYYAVTRLCPNGFAASASGVPLLTGLADLHDGARHLHQCLIVASEVDGDERIFTVKRASSPHYAALWDGDDVAMVSASH